MIALYVLGGLALGAACFALAIVLVALPYATWSLLRELQRDPKRATSALAKVPERAEAKLHQLLDTYA